MYNYWLQQSFISRVDGIMDLGVYFYSQSMSDVVFSRARRKLGILQMIRCHFCKLPTFFKLYSTILHPILQYCSAVWSYNRAYSIDRIKAVQGKFCRVMVYKGFVVPASYEELCHKLNIVFKLHGR